MRFWILLIISVVLSALVISLFIKVLKAVIFVILVLALAPVIYLALRLILPGKKRRSSSDELQRRD